MILDVLCVCPIVLASCKDMFFQPPGEKRSKFIYVFYVRLAPYQYVSEQRNVSSDCNPDSLYNDCILHSPSEQMPTVQCDRNSNRNLSKWIITCYKRYLKVAWHVNPLDIVLPFTSKV